MTNNADTLIYGIPRGELCLRIVKAVNESAGRGTSPWLGITSPDEAASALSKYSVNRVRELLAAREKVLSDVLGIEASAENIAEFRREFPTGSYVVSDSGNAPDEPSVHRLLLCLDALDQICLLEPAPTREQLLAEIHGLDAARKLMARHQLSNEPPVPDPVR